MNPRRAIAVFLFLVAALAPASAANVKALNAVKGAQVWFAEDHTVPMIALTASLPAGSAYDPSAKAGLAAFAAYLLDEGAGNLDSAAFQAALANRAIRLGVEPDRDSMTVTLTVLSSNAKEAFRLLGLALSHPRFDAEAVNRVRVQMLQSLEQDKSDPASVAEKSFYSFYFGAHAYGHPVEGDTRGLMAVTPEDLKTFARSHWVRGGLQDRARRRYQCGDRVCPAAPGFRRAAAGRAAAASAAHPRRRAGIAYRGDGRAAAVCVLRLAGSAARRSGFHDGLCRQLYPGRRRFPSRLTSEVRGKRGLTYDVSTDLVPYRKAGLLLGEVATRKDAMRQTIAVVRETMRKFAADGPTQQELADAKAYLNGSFPLTFASDEGLAAQLNTFQQMGLGLDYLGKRADLINAVTIDDVRRVAQRLFDPAKMTIVVAGTLPDEKTVSSP